MTSYGVPANIIELDVEQLGKLDAYPDASVLEIRRTRTEVMRAYKLCYEVRGRGRGSSDETRLVELTSLNRHRVRALNFLIADEGAKFSVIYPNIAHALSIIDNELNTSKFDLTSIPSCKMFYREFTEYLLGRMAESPVGGDPLAPNYAQGLQKGLAYLVYGYHEATHTLDQVRRWARIISTKRNQKRNERKADIELSLYPVNSAIHLELFNTFSSIVIERQKEGRSRKLKTVRVRDFLGSDALIIRSSIRWPGQPMGKEGPLPKLCAGFILEFFQDLDERNIEYDLRHHERLLNELMAEFDISLTKARRVTDTYRRLLKDPYWDDYAVMLFYKRAVTHFLFLLAYESGVNKEQLVNADYRKVFTNKGERDKRIIKARAGNRLVEIRYSLKNFGHIIRRFQEMVKAFESLTGVVNTEGLLIPLSGKRVITGFTSVTFKSARIERINGRDLHVSRICWPKSIEFIPFREVRPFRDINVVQATGSVELAAQLQGRSIEVTREVYLRKMAMIDAAVELAPFFDAMAKVGKAQEDGSLLRIVENATRIPSGGCTADEPSQAKLIEGADEFAPDPKCTAFTTCFFCEQYALHSDAEDIKKVLSVREFLRLSGRKNGHDIDEFMIKFRPLIERIDQIVSEFSILSNTHREIVKQCEKEVAEGDLDEFWENIINALIEAKESH